jgi:hypothetical protein
MKRESTIRREIGRTKYVQEESHSNYCGVSDLVSDAEEFARKYGKDLSDVCFEATIVTDYGGDSVEIMLSMTVDKTPEEIEAEFQKALKETREAEQRQKEREIQQYEQLKKKFER